MLDPKRLLPSIACLVSLSIAAPAQDPPPAEAPAAEIDTRGLVRREAGSFEGYTLLAPFSYDAMVLVDMAGEIVHQWDLPGTESAIPLANGNLLRWGLTPECIASMGGEESDRRFQGPGVGGGLIEEVDWDGNVLWRFVLDEDQELLHHDIALLPSGNVLFLAWEYRTREEAIEAGRDPRQVDERGMWPDVVYEIRPTPPEGGEVVWEWHAWDHLVQDFDEAKENHGSVPDAAGRIDVNADHRDQPPLTLQEIAAREKLEREMAALGYGGSDDDDEEEEEDARRGTAPDWLHTNAIDHLPAHDLIVLSSPSMNELWVIDHSTSSAQAAGDRGGRFGRGGELLWRWGNPRNYGAGEDGDQRLSYQHDPTWLASENPNELRLLVFNNGRVRAGEPHSSVDELVLPFDPERGFTRAPGAAFAPAEPAWTYADAGTFYSPFISGAQRLPNGNTLICSGVQGRIFEVTRKGEVVWDLRNPWVGEIDFGIPKNALYRAVRIPKDHPVVAGRGH